jgi:hypothetical protein
MKDRRDILEHLVRVCSSINAHSSGIYDDSILGGIKARNFKCSAR